MKRLWIPLSILAAGGAAAYLIFRKGSDQTPSPIPEPSGPPPPPRQPDSDFPLKFGSRNSSVAVLQRALGVKDDGIFGTNTLNALKSKTGRTEVKNANELAEVQNRLVWVQQQNDANAKRRQVGQAFMRQRAAMPLSQLVISTETRAGEYVRKAMPIVQDGGFPYTALNRTRVFKAGETFRDWEAERLDMVNGTIMVRIGKQFFSFSPYALKLK